MVFFCGFCVAFAPSASCSRFPSMEGWQAQPDGVVLCTGADCVCTTAATTPRLAAYPPREGNWQRRVFNCQARRGNAGKAAAKRQAFNQTQTHFWYFFCVLCVTSAPSAFCPRISAWRTATTHSPAWVTSHPPYEPCLHHHQPPPACGVPLHGRGIGNGWAFNWQARRGNAARRQQSAKPLPQTKPIFGISLRPLRNLCALCVLLPLPLPPPYCCLTPARALFQP